MQEESASIELLETLYQQYQKNPSQLDASWRLYFDQLYQPSEFTEKKSTTDDGRVLQLIEAYRSLGHLKASVNPINLRNSPTLFLLQPATYGLSVDDLPRFFSTYGLLNSSTATLEQILKTLENIYSTDIGIEYKGCNQNQELEKWIQDRVEKGYFQQSLSIEDKTLILEYLNRSEIFESFLHTKYVGQKRFSLEGNETLIPMLALLVEDAAASGVEEIVLGMAHRGRLNVLSNILHKSYDAIFAEFDDGYIPESFEGTGDVKYHKGYSSDQIKTRHGAVLRLTLPPNPSHLESVDPIVEGVTRAKQFKHQDEIDRKKIIPLLIHGDAALAGQGVIYETLQFCRLPGYKTGGTLHIAINNQIGFTTLPRDSRSTPYCTDIAHAFGAPVFHVNAENPDSCILAMRMAFEIRNQFHCDVFIDLNGYRKYGHNESDEPAFTQPLEYRLIKSKRPIREIYRDTLIQQGVVEKQMAEELESVFRRQLQEAHAERKTSVMIHDEKDLMEVPSQTELFKPFKTGVAADELKEIGRHFSFIPDQIKLHPKLESLVKERLNAILNESMIDWGLAEYLAYGSLVWQGKAVRLAGQDTGRGTFSHRHALWVDQVQQQEYYPLAHLKKDQGRFEVWNSPLSEFAALGFEYGYSVAFLEGLTIWEAQFGDFSNGAQVVIDQYIASGEQKWGQKSGLTLFLPHGYEGQGPEHSSSRLERFLTLAGHDNMQIVNPTTPAQLFHLLRRQVLRPLRKPLIVFTPKGLLRFPASMSHFVELTDGSFQEIIVNDVASEEITRLVFCSGRIYYDLNAEKKRLDAHFLNFIRIEQLYPLNEEHLKIAIQSYPKLKECLWVQEEPYNMGAWHFIRAHLEKVIPSTLCLRYVGRPASAAPATGSHARHHQEHLNILKQVFSS